uniref:Uncharacterized protein n=1 Tax=Amphimedon queenslandica TaxID=400682 RepID=A0A1X7VGP8_AMPQE
MHWRANETGRFYVKHHSGEGHLTVDDLKDNRPGRRKILKQSCPLWYQSVWH